MNSKDQINKDNQPIVQFKEMSIHELSEILTHTIKNDYENKIITFLAMLSAYTDQSQLNISFNAPSSSGKTYIATEIASLFPDEDKIERSGASPKSFYHSEGKQIVKDGKKYKLVDLERKIILFYEQPTPELQKNLRGVLSHDQRELIYSVAGKDKGKNKTEDIMIRGFPSSIFCSAGLRLDEQEATRAILLSPEVSEEKLKEGVHLAALRGSNEAGYNQWLESLADRNLLMSRIKAIRDEKVDSVIVNDAQFVEDKFKETFGRLKPRHMRDMSHLLNLIKAIALLNVWHRTQSDGRIIASSYDIDIGFDLWSKVIESQDLNVPPVVLSFYKNFILPAYAQKAQSPKFTAKMEAELIGIESQEISSYYMQKEKWALNQDTLRKQIIPQLVSNGMVAFEQPKDGDKRSKHIFPKWFPNGKDNLFQANNVGQEGEDVPSEYEQLIAML
jgi:hypothetical protein